jgi:hypothetical protein
MHSAPLGAIRQARLLLRSGATDLSLSGNAGPAELFRARFDGKQPTVRVRDDTVVIAYREGMRDIIDWRKRSAVIGLSRAIPWSVEIRGGMSKARADLTSIDLRSFQLNGGAIKVRLDLGAPSGVVPVRLTGGAMELRIERPGDVPARLRVKGGATRVAFDEQSLGTASDLSLESPGASEASARYDIEVNGGADRVTVSRRAA